QIRSGERDLLAALCDRGQFAKKRFGQLTPLFKTSAKDRLALAAMAVRRMQRGQLIPPDDLLSYLPLEQLKQLRRGEAIELDHLTNAMGAMLSKPPKRMTRDEAIDKVAALMGIDDQKLANYMDGKIGFGRKKAAQQQL